MRFWGGGKPIQIGTKCCPKWPGLCWLYLFRSSLSKDEMEALEVEFHDLGNMFNFQTSCLLNVIKCVIYSSKILSIALIFFFSSFESSNNNSKF